jgi:type II secretory ATPase GspE/PulE/Tfp pilus assembly ATPase PilB-like protein
VLFRSNDAASAATRLLDMDIQPYLIASSIIGVLAQRLIRRICPRCREECQPTAAELDQLNISAEQASRLSFHRGRGCEHCRNTGYHGRSGIYELMRMTNTVRDLVTHKATAADIREAGRQEGMRTMKEDALLKIDQGMTSASEVVRAIFTIED